MGFSFDIPTFSKVLLSQHLQTYKEIFNIAPHCRIPPPQERMVLTPTLSSMGIGTTQLTADNEDFSDRNRVHHSYNVDRNGLLGHDFETQKLLPPGRADDTASTRSGESGTQ